METEGIDVEAETVEEEATEAATVVDPESAKVKSDEMEVVVAADAADTKDNDDSDWLKVGLVVQVKYGGKQYQNCTVKSQDTSRAGQDRAPFYFVEYGNIKKTKFSVSHMDIQRQPAKEVPVEKEVKIKKNKVSFFQRIFGKKNKNSKQKIEEAAKATEKKLEVGGKESTGQTGKEPTGEAGKESTGEAAITQVTEEQQEVPGPPEL